MFCAQLGYKSYRVRSNVELIDLICDYESSPHGLGLETINLMIYICVSVCVV